MSNINKQARQVSRFDLVSGYMQKLPDGEYVFHSDYQALLDELEAKDKRIAELEAREVELPEPFKMAKSSSGLTYYYEDEVNNAIRAAGISIKVGE